MASDGSILLSLIRDSIATPREAAGRLLALRPPLGVVLEAAVLVSVLDALLVGVLSGGAFAIPLPEGQMVLSPLMHAALLAASLLISAGALQVGGQLLGGRGRFDQALLVVVWLEVVAIAIQLVELAAALLLAPLAPLLALAGLALLLWCVVHFTRALHGFSGYGRTLLALLLGAFAIGIALSALLGLFGFGGPADV
ncbi:YIP1 family protein [Rubellimicrobium aerolatum]|uniref:YIP1 family protein n=1 Tax=Rubellimicrobium aerolatum TaxID=490979 RepID=A0ABW0S8E7_9RHOB|nr:YIP1 family protein [Rubellimicrobium aerolatum]MBP1804237.1 hypothetical protein [Rubellimicrobium aerolatum]